MGIGDTIRDLGNVGKMRQRAMEMQKSLAAQQVTVEENGVKVVITGDQRILELSVQGIGNPVLNEALNKAIRRTQELAAQELMKITGGQM